MNRLAMGQTVTEVAKAEGVHKGTVSAWLWGKNRNEVAPDIRKAAIPKCVDCKAVLTNNNQKRCKSCVSIYKVVYAKRLRERLWKQMQAKNKAYKEAHKEELRIKGKLYQEAHREEINAKNKAWRESHKEAVKARRQVDKERTRVRNKLYRETHREELKAKRSAKKGVS